MKQKTVVIWGYDLCRLPFDGYHIGDEMILVEYTKETTRNVTWGLVPHQGHGIGGNMNRKITRYHGWRGTTDGKSTTAHGVRKILKVSPVKQDRDGWNYIKVTVGRDLHPEWD